MTLNLDIFQKEMFCFFVPIEQSLSLQEVVRILLWLPRSLDSDQSLCPPLAVQIQFSCLIHLFSC